MISVDNWLNETTRHAHVVLPGLSPLERAHCDDLYWMYAIASCVKWSDPVLAPPAGRPQEWEIMLRLAGALLGTPLPDVDVPAMDDLYTQGIIYTACQAADTPLFGRDPEEVFAALRGRGPEGMIDLGVRVGPWGEDLGRRPGGLTLEEVRRQPDGLRLGELEGGRLNEVLTTPSGRIELMHPLLAADIPRLHAADQAHHAARLGVTDGHLVDVCTTEGSIRVVAEVTDEMMAGVVSLPRGWGHGVDGTRLDVANAHPAPTRTCSTLLC